ncbi:MAG: DUF2442 domain-containing protein [Thermodesulfobacteriota bacterium]
MSQSPLIMAVRTMGHLNLSIDWSTNETLAVDLAGLMAGSAVLAPLGNDAFFAQVTVEEWGHGLDWPGGLDLGADLLYKLGREQAGLLSPSQFDRWMRENNLTLSTAAEALGMSRRMIAHYRTGSRPIPRVVQLACLGWEVAQRQRAA